MGFMFNFFRKKANAKKQEYLEKCNRELHPYMAEGLMRVVFQTTEFTVLCVVNSVYAIMIHSAIDTETKLTCGMHFRGGEFKMFMEEPTMENFKWFNYACQKQGEKRGFAFTPDLIAKFRELRKKLEAEGKIEVDLELEKRLVAEAKRKYPHIG